MCETPVTLGFFFLLMYFFQVYISTAVNQIKILVGDTTMFNPECNVFNPVHNVSARTIDVFTKIIVDEQLRTLARQEFEQQSMISLQDMIDCVNGDLKNLDTVSEIYNMLSRAIAKFINSNNEAEINRAALKLINW